VKVSRREFLKGSLIFGSILASGCSKLITGPSSLDSDVRSLWLQAGAGVGIHPFDVDKSENDPTGQKYHLKKMIDAGMLKVARVEHLGEEPKLSNFGNWLAGQGVDVLGLFPNYHLRSPDFLKQLEGYINSNPYVKVWEIGNEVANPAFMNGPGMDATEYIGSRGAPGVFRRASAYMRDNHPELAVMTQSDFLPEMVKAGLGEVIGDSPYNTIIAIHPYHRLESNSIEEYRRELTKVAGQAGAKPRVWATETGVNSWPAHIDFIRNYYPAYQKSLGTEVVLWYVFSECTDFALIRGLPQACSDGNITFSPLYKELVGDYSVSGTAGSATSMSAGAGIVPGSTSSYEIAPRQKMPKDIGSRRRQE